MSCISQYIRHTSRIRLKLRWPRMSSTHNSIHSTTSWLKNINIPFRTFAQVFIHNSYDWSALSHPPHTPITYAACKYTHFESNRNHTHRDDTTRSACLTSVLFAHTYEVAQFTSRSACSILFDLCQNEKDTHSHSLTITKTHQFAASTSAHYQRIITYLKCALCFDHVMT